MRVKYFVKMYRGMKCLEVEIYAKVYSERKENFMAEEVFGFEVVSGKLKLFIRGCE